MGTMILGQSALRFRPVRHGAKEGGGGELVMTWNSGIRDMIKESKNFASFKCPAAAWTETLLISEGMYTKPFVRDKTVCN